MSVEWNGFLIDPKSTVVNDATNVPNGALYEAFKKGVLAQKTEAVKQENYNEYKHEFVINHTYNEKDDKGVEVPKTLIRTVSLVTELELKTDAEAKNFLLTNPELINTAIDENKAEIKIAGADLAKIISAEGATVKLTPGNAISKQRPKNVKTPLIPAAANEAAAKAQEVQLAVLFAGLRGLIRSNLNNFVELTKKSNDPVEMNKLYLTFETELAKSKAFDGLAAQEVANLKTANKQCFEALMKELNGKVKGTEALEAKHSKAFTLTLVAFAASLVGIFIAASNTQLLNNFAASLSNTSKISGLGKLMTSCLQFANKLVATDNGQKIAMGVAGALSLTTIASGCAARVETLKINDEKALTIKAIEDSLKIVALTA